MAFNATESSWQRALRDTNDVVHSAWWFWGAEVVAASAASVWAVTIYPRNASTLTQALIQAAALIGAFILFAILVLLANLVAWSPRRQRMEARDEVTRLGQVIAEQKAKQLTREDLLEARQRLGSIMADAGDLLAGWMVTPNISDEAMKIFHKALDLFRGETPFFDESHVGRYYPVITRTRHEATREVGVAKELEPEVERKVLMAQLEFFEHLMAEINAELLTLPR